jgi:precorrin-8X/cobalt-precorrin-8 methylmutase
VLFEEFVMVDWSAASRPTTGADSIWVAHGPAAGDVDVINPSTRQAAQAAIGMMIEAALARAHRVLVGFDFSFGYPRGFANSIGLVPGAGTAWASTCQQLAARVLDDPANANNRFSVAAELNAASGLALFWGRPQERSFDHLEALPARRIVPERLAPNLCAPYRVTERWAGRGIRSTFQLYGAGSVGGQTLTGVPVLWRLVQRFRPHSVVWPFESGFTDDLFAPTSRQSSSRVVFAEIWPSHFGRFDVPGMTRDEAQVRGLVATCCSLASDEWAEWFHPDLSSLDDEESRRVTDEEGWILGVTGAPTA